MATLEADRDRHQKRASLIDQRDQATADISSTADSLRSRPLATVQQCAASARSLRETDPLADIDAALEHAASINADPTDQQIRELEALAKKQETGRGDCGTAREISNGR